jgi:hypothetical protein
VVTVKSGLDPHMIIELEDENKLWFILIKWFEIMPIIIYTDVYYYNDDYYLCLIGLDYSYT